MCKIHVFVPRLCGAVLSIGFGRYAAGFHDGLTSSDSRFIDQEFSLVSVSGSFAFGIVVQHRKMAVVSNPV